MLRRLRMTPRSEAPLVAGKALGAAQLSLARSRKAAGCLRSFGWRESPAAHAEARQASSESLKRHFVGV
jgi:hypothetical protein